MAKSYVISLSVLIALTSAVPVYAGPTIGQQNARPVEVHIQGLNRIAMDMWTGLLAQGRSEGLSVLQVRERMSQLLANAKNEKEVFSGIQKIMADVKMQSAEDYRDLGIMLLELRQELRQQKEMTMRARQDGLFMMQLLAEESFFVGSKKFSNFPTEISIGGTASVSGSRVADLREHKVQTGDIVLSKSTGYGSSSLISFIMDHPHIFSHSTPTFIGENGELLSPEAEIEDGVKLRRMHKDYIQGSKTRMYIYRYQGPRADIQEQVELGAQNLINDMYKKTGNDPFNKAAFPYDFSMSAGHAEEFGLFCSAVGYEMYIRAGLSGNENPYNKKVWSNVSNGREELLKTLNMNTEKVPAPGDMELNPEFHLVGARIDTTKIGQERVEAAILDVFLSEVERNKDLLKMVSESLNAVAAKQIDKSGLQLLAKSGLLPEEVAKKLALVDKIPDSINLKQLIFFGLINDVMTPKIRAALMQEISAAEASGEIVGPIKMRKMARKYGLSVLSEVEKMQKQISAITGVGFCSKILN